MWKEIPNAPGYMVSNRGAVISPRKLLALHPDGGGYLRVRISGKTIQVHKLVAIAFIPKPQLPTKFEIAHLDGNKLNNSASNLKWVSHRENLRMMERHANTSHYTEKWWRCRFSDTTVRKVREATGTCAEIAARFGMSPSQAWKIRANKQRRHVI